MLSIRLSETDKTSKPREGNNTAANRAQHRKGMVTTYRTVLLTTSSGRRRRSRVVHVVQMGPVERGINMGRHGTSDEVGRRQEPYQLRLGGGPERPFAQTRSRPDNHRRPDPFSTSVCIVHSLSQIIDNARRRRRALFSPPRYTAFITHLPCAGILAAASDASVESPGSCSADGPLNDRGGTE